MIKTTISIQKKIICNCSAYPYPHAVGQGLCRESLSQKPPFVAPKRGLASKLCKFIDDLEQEIENLEEVEAIAKLLINLKQDLSIGNRETDSLEYEHN